MEHKTKGLIYAGLAAILWGSSAAVTKLLLEDLENIQILTIASGIASITLLLAAYLNKSLGEIRKYTPKDYAIFAGMGFLGAFLYRFLLQAAINTIPAQEAFVINYLWPIMVILFARLILKEKITLIKLVGLTVSFIGVVIVITGGNLSSLKFDGLGILFAITGAVVYGLYSVLGKKLHYDKYTSAAMFYIFTFLYSILAMLIFTEVPNLEASQWLGLAWMGAFPFGLAFAFWLLALKHGDTAIISNLIFITPFISIIYVYVLLDEPILLSSVIGLIVIVSGIVIQSYNKRLVKETD